MGKLRALHVIASVAPRYGGTTTAVLGLADALARASGVGGVEVELAATDADGPDRLSANAFAGRPFAAHLFPVTGSARWKRSAGLRDWLGSNAGRFDVVHLHGAWSYSTLAGRRAAVAAGRPFVLSPHGMLSRYSFGRSALLKRAYWRALERPTVLAARALIATTDGEADELRQLGLATPIRVVPLGVDAWAWSTTVDPCALRRLCGPAAGERPIVLFLSRLHPKKGVADVLLPAFARVAEPAYLAIAGGPDSTAPDYLGEVERAVTRLGLAGRVGLLGSVAAADRWRLFDGAAAFALPSYQENFGLVVAEAMARACPVVVSDRVQSHPHVTRAGAGRVVPLDPGAVAAALAECLRDPAAARAAGKRGQDYARSAFGWGGVADRLSEVYQSCL